MAPELLAQVKASLGIPPEDTTQDAAISAAGDAALAAMRRATGRVLYPVHVVREHFALTHAYPYEGDPVLWLCQLPVVAIDVVTEGGAPADPTRFRAMPTGRLLRDGAPVRGAGGVVVEYRAGYAELPADLYAALVDLCGKAASAPAGSSPGVVRKISIVDVGSVDYADAGGEGADPILGDWTSTVEAYASPAAALGGHPLGETEIVGLPVPP